MMGGPYHMTYLYNNLKVDLGTQISQIYLNVVIMNNIFR